MEHSIRIGAATLATAVALGFVAGCSHTVSHNVDDAGHAEKIVFPAIDVNTWMREGTYPDVARLREVHPGMTKDQLRDALGPPHFDEGLWNVREWDYLFNLRASDGQVARCQFKIVFDKDMIARGLHALPANCAS